MRWRNSLLSPLVFFPALAALALAGVQLFYALPVASRPPGLWFLSVAIGLFAPIGALLFGLRLRRRLRELYAFTVVVPERCYLPSLPMWNEDELGILEVGLQRLFSQQFDRMRALHGECKKLEAVLQSMADGVVVVDLRGTIVLCNRAARELFGLNPTKNWQGQPLQALSRHPGLQKLLQDVAHQQPGDQPLTCEVEIDGREPRPLEVSMMQICEDGTKVSGYVLVCHDLTQLKRLESVRADFVANVSHELRTPLTAIKGYAETLLNGALKDPDTATRFLMIIDRHSERLSRLIDDLLTLSNLELGRAELRHEEVLLADLVDEVCEVVKDKAERGAVTLRQDIPAELPALVGDGDRLHQVFLNLIDNAVKYTPTGGRVTVTAKVVRDPEAVVWSQTGSGNGGAEVLSAPRHVPGGQEWVEVAVKDTGCGIPEADIPRLTQRFYRVDKARSRELGGTGLGLAIVKHIVQAHGGFLQIESQLNTGTTVHIYLPLSSLPVLSTGQAEDLFTFPPSESA